MSSREDLDRTQFGVVLALLICLAFGLQALVFLNGFYAASFDDSFRTIDAYQWAHDRSSVSRVWLPAHRILLGSVIRIWSDLFLAPRVVSSVLGAASLLLVAWLAQGLFGSRRIAAVAALFALVFPARVVLSAVPLTEILFIVTMLAALGFTCRWTASNGRSTFLLAVVCFALGTTVRYEGWVFAGLFLLVSLATGLRTHGPGRPGVASFMIAATLIAAFPLYWLVHLCRSPDGIHQLAFAAAKQYSEIHSATVGNLIRHNPVTQLVMENSKSMTLVGVIPLVGAVVADRRMRIWSAVPILSLVLIAILSIATLSLPSHCFWRTAAVWGMLLIPFTACWVFRCGRDVTRSRRVGYILLMMLILIPSLLQCKEMTRRSSLTSQDLALARRLDSLLTTGEREQGTRVLLDISSWHYIHLMVASQHPYSFILNAGHDVSRPGRPILDPVSGVDPEELRARNIGFLVFYSPELVSRLEDSPFTFFMDDYGPWVLYRFDPGTTPPKRAPGSEAGLYPGAR